MHRFASSLVALALTVAAPAQGSLELGKMWTFENPPLAYLELTYGLVRDQAWLDAMRLASLRFGSGCSASFVSANGLIMTNHHCVRDYVARVSPPDQDWVKHGFVARDHAAEVRVPDLTVQQLVGMRDVTAAINAGVADGDGEAAIAAKQGDNQKRLLEAARAEHPDLQPQVVRLHQGAVFQLYLYKVWDDVRLVCTPHLQTAHFGGDPDNFTYPRYSIDFAFCRAWVDGKPADTSAHHFRWSATGPVEGEVVFVTGNPGSTDRLKTKAQMDSLRDASYPMIRQMIDHRIALLREASTASAEQEKALRTQILTFENGQKAYMGYHGGLLDAALMTRKVRAECALKDKVLADPTLAARFGPVWTKLEEIAALRTATEPQRRFHAAALPPAAPAPGGSRHLARALALVRAVTDPDPEARAQHAEKARTMATDMTALERAQFIDHLARARDWLPPTDPFRHAVLGERTPLQSAELLEASSIRDTAFVDKLLAAGEVAVKIDPDPAVRMAVVLEPLLRAKDKVDGWLAEQEAALGTKVGLALFSCFGDKISPDATFTLRFSDGVVAGYPCNGTLAPWRTTFYGLYGRHAEFDGRHPFDLPAEWLEGKDRIDLGKAVNFVSTNDIIGGNSGSPIVNAELEVVGLVFDGNIEMLANRFVYTDEKPRAVSVHVHAILESLTKVYGAQHVADELLAR